MLGDMGYDRYDNDMGYDRYDNVPSLLLLHVEASCFSLSYLLAVGLSSSVVTRSYG